MKQSLLVFLLLIFPLGIFAQTTPKPQQSSGSGATWYVRVDGGTRYTAQRIANGLTGQCDGLADAPYPGSGTNQHCAFNDYRFLYDDQTYGNSAWVISGGDTVIIKQKSDGWRVGFDQGLSSNDKWCFGGYGSIACSDPTIPSGTPSQHTRILGENYASCGAGVEYYSKNPTADRTKVTQIFGGFLVGEVLKSR